MDLRVRFRREKMKRKWRSLRKRGFTPPKTKEEATKRLKEAHQK